MPHASGKPGTPFHGWIIDVVWWDGEQSLEDLKNEHYWLGPLVGVNTDWLRGRWLGRLSPYWVLYTWTPVEFAKEMELDTWQPS